MMDRIYLSVPDVGEAERAAVTGALASGWVAPAGPALKTFESAVSQRCGRGHALAINSGTAAIHLALMVLGIGRGDCVLCPSFTFAATLNPVLYCGAEPELVDSDRQTWNMDPSRLRACLERGRGGNAPAVKAVIACSIYGNCSGMAEIEAICAEFGVPLIEDAAEALGATCAGRPAGSFGTLSVFSFNGNKIITTSGGGMLLGDEGDLIDRARYLSTQAREPVRHYEHRAVGYNYRLSNLLAALGSSQLQGLHGKIGKREAIFRRYIDAFGKSTSLQPMPAEHWDAPNFWLSCFLTESSAMRDRILDALEAANIEGRPLWKPLHLQPAYADVPVHGGSVAEDLFNRGLCLPSGSGLTVEQQAAVIAAVAAVIGLANLKNACCD